MATERPARPVVFGRHLPLRMDEDTIRQVEQAQEDLNRDRSYTVRTCCSWAWRPTRGSGPSWRGTGPIRHGSVPPGGDDVLGDTGARARVNVTLLGKVLACKASQAYLARLPYDVARHYQDHPADMGRDLRLVLLQVAVLLEVAVALVLFASWLLCGGQ